ncbi:carboxypeptidase regulatory-like domain-containing protein [bacterium]|nr:carboxypeptidase regulatory-like domain-containing protein [bacterium]
MRGARIIVVPAAPPFRFKAGENDLLECERVVAEVYTDAQGNYFADVPAGNYRVWAWYPRHVPADRVVRAPGRASFSLAPNPIASTFHQTLTVKQRNAGPTPPGQDDDKVKAGIRGRVTRPIAQVGRLPGASPVEGARIVVLPAALPFRFKAGENDLLECERVVAEAHTDAQGNYFADVPAGNYRVWAWYPRHVPADRVLTAPGRANFSLAPNPIASTFHQTLEVKRRRPSR